MFLKTLDEKQQFYLKNLKFLKIGRHSEWIWNITKKVTTCEKWNQFSNTCFSGHFFLPISPFDCFYQYFGVMVIAKSASETHSAES